MSVISILGKHQILPGDSKTITLGCINLHAKHANDGWFLGTSETGKEDINSLPEQEILSDFFQTGKSNSLVIKPSLPCKPMVFKGILLHVLPNQKITFFLKIPLSFQIYYSRVIEENLLKEISYKTLSDTWFGEPDNGEPAFALGSEYSLEFNKIENSECEAICPVTVQNKSADVLNLQRLIIRDEYMTLYRNEGKIVTSSVDIEYKGNDVISSADYSYSKIFNGEKQVILADPKNTSIKKLLKINFHFIKNIYKGE